MMVICMSMFVCVLVVVLFVISIVCVDGEFVVKLVGMWVGDVEKMMEMLKK